LRNNRAYALVATGRYAEGANLIASCLENSDGDAQAIATATSGFLCMRLGDYKQGTKLYRDAIAYMKRSNRVASESLAWAYFAQEAARAELPEAAQILADARNASEHQRHLPEPPILLERAERWMEAVAHRKEQKYLVGGLLKN
jgi:hypothetical protein